MNRDYLTKSAKALSQPASEASAEFTAVRDDLAARLNQKMVARPDLDRLIGEGNRPMMEDNSRNFCRFMGTMFQAYEPIVLVETALWVFRAYRSHGFQTAYWPANLDTFVEIARERLSPKSFDEIYPFLEWLIVNIPVFVSITDGELTDPTPGTPRHE